MLGKISCAEHWLATAHWPKRLKKETHVSSRSELSSASRYIFSSLVYRLVSSLDPARSGQATGSNGVRIDDRVLMADYAKEKGYPKNATRENA
jgi:hypothetical protein